MAVKADWHEAAPAAGGLDPFAAAAPAAAIPPLSLDISIDELKERVIRLFKRERFLDERMGLRCPIKDKCDTTCYACPLNEAADPDSPKGSLCKVGLKQEQAETLLAVKLEHGV